MSSREARLLHRRRAISRFHWTLLLAVVALLPSLAQAESRVLLNAARTTVRLGNTTTVEVEIEGSQLDQAPRFLQSEHFDVSLAGRSSSFSMTQGRVEQRTTFTFQVTGRTEGRHSLGPAEAIIDGKKVRSNAVEIEVIAARASRPGETRQSPASRGPGAQSGAEDWYAVAEVSQLRPFVGQSLAYTLEVGIAVAVRGMHWERPAWGTLSPEPGIEHAQSEHPEVLDGRRYNVSQVVVPLFALEDGRVTIEPSTLQIGVVRRGGSFLQPTRQQSFSSNTIDLEVRPLPGEGRPPDFGGAVGRFGLKATVDRSRVDAGETISLSLTLAGTGSLRSPEIDLDLPDALRVYSEQPNRRVRLVGTELRSEVVFREAIVPLEPGSYTIPSVRFAYFDPKAMTYRHAKSQPIRIEVGGTAVVDPAIVARSADLTHAKKSVEVLGSDILPLHTGPRMLGDTRITVLSPWVALLLLLPALGYGSLSLAERRKRFAGTSRGREQARLRAAKAACKTAAAAALNDDAVEAEHAVRIFLTARLNTSADAFSSDDSRRAVEAAGLPPARAEGLGNLLERCEAVRFGGGSPSGLANDLARWVEQAEREWP